MYIMKRINRQINAWWKYNIALTREQKMDAEEEEKPKEKEDLSMFERNLTLPDEGAICVDSNLHVNGDDTGIIAYMVYIEITLALQ